MTKYSVAVVDDHFLLSQAISGVVDSFANFTVCYLSKNGEELIQKIKSIQVPDLVLMDVNMPIMNGIETTKWLSENYPNIKVLALSVEENENTIIQMIKSGAKGYLLKDTDKFTLEKALNKVIETGFYHSNTVAQALMHSVTTNEPEIEKNNLKEVEIQFLKLVCTELTYKEIAEKMSVSPKTVDGYRDNLFVKLNVKNRIGLVLYAIKNKIYNL